MANHDAFQYFGMASSTEGEHRPVLTSSISSPSIFTSPHYATAGVPHSHQPYDDADRQQYDGHHPLQIDVSYAQQAQYHDAQTASGSASEQFYDLNDSHSGNFDQQHYHHSQQSHFLAPSSSASSSRHGGDSSSSSTGGLGAGMGGSTGGGGSHAVVPAGMPTQDVTQPTSASTSSTSGGKTSVASLTKGISRARVNMACINCRSRKIRCDGDRPSCSTCKRLNRPCNYESISEEENASVRERKRRSRELKQARLSALSNISVGSLPHGRRQYDQPPHTAHYTGGMGMMPPSGSKLIDMQGRRHSASSSLSQFTAYPGGAHAQYQHGSAPGPSVLREGRSGVGIGERHSPYPLMPPYRQSVYPANAAPPPLPSPALSQSTSSPVQATYAQAPFHPQPYQPAPPAAAAAAATQRSWQSQVPPLSPVSARYGAAPQQSAVRRRADTVGGYDDYSRGPHDQVLAWRGQLNSSSGGGGDALLPGGDLAAVSGGAAAYEMMPAQAPAMMGMSQPASPEHGYPVQGTPILGYDYNGGGGHASGGSTDHSPGNPDIQFWRWSGGGGAQPPPGS